MIEALQQEVDKTDKSYPNSQSPPNMPNKRMFQGSVDSSGLLSGKKHFSEPPPSLPPPMRSSVYAPNQFQGPMRQLPLPSPPMSSSASMESNASAMIPGIGQPRQAAYQTVVPQQHGYGIDTSGTSAFMPTSPSAMSSTMPSTSTTPSLSGRTFVQYVHQQQPNTRFMFDYAPQAATEPSAQPRVKQNESVVTPASNTPTAPPASGSSPSTRSMRRNQQESPVEDQQATAAKPDPITGSEWSTWDRPE